MRNAISGLQPIVTQNISAENIPALSMEKRERQTSRKTWIPGHLCTCLDSGHILPLGDRTEFTLGRVSEAQPIMPDIDLTPYQAYANGVSRLHAVLKREGNRVLVMDLGSSNGTYLNGKRLTPNVDQTLSHGDMLALGKLKIQILLKNP
jgi:hypothetical protein